MIAIRLLTLFFIVALLSTEGVVGQKDSKSKRRKRTGGSRRPLPSSDADAAVIKPIEAHPEKPRKKPRQVEDVPIDSELAERMKNDFDWHAYLEMNADLMDAGLHTQRMAEQHYLRFGRHEGRLFPERYPERGAMTAARRKLEAYVSLLGREGVPKAQRALVIQHIGWPTAEHSLELLTNNLRYFLGAVLSDSSQAAPKAFYWINVIGGDANPLHSVLMHLTTLTNAALLPWTAAPSTAMYIHLRTMMMLPVLLKKDFQLVLCLSSAVRGPFAQRERGEWIASYLSLLQPANASRAVGLVGSLLSCEQSPHIAAHALGISTHLLDAVIAHYRPFRAGADLQQHYEQGLSQLVREKLGADMASLQYAQVFDGTCRRPADRRLSVNPSAWCDLDLHRLLFIKYDLRTCKEVQQRVLSVMFQDKGSALPEALAAGPWLPLYRDYALELARDRNQMYYNSMHRFTRSSAQLSAVEATHLQALDGGFDKGRNDSNVCFIVKCCGKDESSSERLQEVYARMHEDLMGAQLNRSAADLQAFLRAQGQTLQDMFFQAQPDLEQSVTKLMDSLQRQTSPRWRVFFYFGDHYSALPQVKQALLKLLEPYGDRRVAAIDLPASVRFAKDSSGEAEFRALLHAVTAAFSQQDCAYVSLSALGTAYGSDVIRSVLTARSRSAPNKETRAVVTAVDSSQGVYANEHEALPGDSYSSHCSGYLQHLQTNTHAYSAYPALSNSFQCIHSKQFNPLYRFLSRDKSTHSNYLYLHNNLQITASTFLRNPADDQAHKDDIFRLFAALHSPQHSPSPHSQSLDHFFPLDQVAVLPSHSMQTMVFLQNSPMLCAAAGDVWLDHRLLSHSRCASAADVQAYFNVFTHFDSPQRVVPMNQRYQQATLKGSAHTAAAGYALKFFDIFDKKDFEEGCRRCLRLSQRGYQLFPGTSPRSEPKDR